jgi:hypothetical protein
MVNTKESYLSIKNSPSMEIVDGARPEEVS